MEVEGPVQDIPEEDTKIPEVPKDSQPTTPPKDVETEVPRDLLEAKVGWSYYWGCPFSFFETYLAKIKSSKGMWPFQILVKNMEECLKRNAEITKQPWIGSNYHWCTQFFPVEGD